MNPKFINRDKPQSEAQCWTEKGNAKKVEYSDICIKFERMQSNSVYNACNTEIHSNREKRVSEK